MSTISRRQFIKMSSAAGASLIIGFYLEGCDQKPAPTATPPESPTDVPTAVPAVPTETPAPEPPFKPNGYVKIDKDGVVTITIHRSEMGQGILTAIPMIVADELGADWSKVRVEAAPADSQFGDQVTGGSVSISGSYEVLRGAGALARTLLVMAAAKVSSYATETLWAHDGVVEHRPTKKQFPFGDLVETAAQLALPQDRVALKDPKDFTLIGKPRAQLNNGAIVTGRATFGLDVRLPNMLYAAVARCPVFGGRVDSYDDSQVRNMPGVRAVVQIDSGVAVIADSSWHAIQARDALVVKWNEGKSPTLSSESIRQECLDLISKSKPQFKPTRNRVFETLYEIPYLAHATMEPMNATADVRGDRCDVWAPTQDRQQALSITRTVTDLPRDQIHIHVPLMGTGVGRRLMVDYVREAVEASQAVKAPVQVVWTRADDLQHDYYRPASYHYLRAEITEMGAPVSWYHLIASQGIFSKSDITAGASNLPYKFGQVTVDAVSPRVPIPAGYWRGVANTATAFANEVFMDELAALTKQDPFDFRLRALGQNDPLRTVIQLAVGKSGWGTPFVEQGHFLGLACHSTWGATPVAQVAEVSVSKDGIVKIHRVVCAVDCGVAVNPDGIQAQMEGGIIFGLTGLLKGEVTFKDGRVQQKGFADYPLPTMTDAPKVEVFIVPSTRSPSGVGEMAGPVIVPAVVNAVFAATGKRIRRLPIHPEDCAS